MTVLIIILIFLILLYIVRISNNKDIIKENSKDIITDKANIKNARKYYSKKKLFKFLLYISVLILIVIILCDFTDIEYQIIDFFSTDFSTEQDINKQLYLLPIYILVIRGIILEVKVGDFLFKYFKVEEPILEENPLKSILYKKPKPDKQDIQKEQSNNKEQKN